MSNAIISTAEHDAGWVPGNTWGARLAIVRQLMGWNVLEAATACGLNATSWTNWEEGKGCRRQDEVAAKIAAATGVSYVWLLTGQAPPAAEVRSRCSDPHPALTVIEGKNQRPRHLPPNRSRAKLRLI